MLFSFHDWLDAVTDVWLALLMLLSVVLTFIRRPTTSERRDWVRQAWLAHKLGPLALAGVTYLAVRAFPAVVPILIVDLVGGLLTGAALRAWRGFRCASAVGMGAWLVVLALRFWGDQMVPQPFAVVLALLAVGAVVVALMGTRSWLIELTEVGGQIKRVRPGSGRPVVLLLEEGHARSALAALAVLMPFRRMVQVTVPVGWVPGRGDTWTEALPNPIVWRRVTLVGVGDAGRVALAVAHEAAVHVNAAVTVGGPSPATGVPGVPSRRVASPRAFRWFTGLALALALRGAEAEAIRMRARA
jgi:hypothetical protein